MVVAENGDKVSDGLLRVCTSDGKVINLATDEHAMSFVGSMRQSAFVSSGLEAMTGDDGVDKFLPKCTRFGVSLESMLHGEHHIARDSNAVAVKVPFGVLVVNEHVSGMVRRRQIRVGIRRVNF
jgi:hypothetical protein